MIISEDKSRVLADLEYLEQHVSMAVPEELCANATHIYNLIARNIGRLSGTPEESLKERYIALVNKIMRYLPNPSQEEVTPNEVAKQVHPMQGVIHKDKIKSDMSEVDIMREYITKRRWNSFYHQIDEIVSIKPDSILEIGVGSGLLRAVLTSVYHCNYNTIDIGEHLHPDYVGSVLDMPFEDSTYDVVGCFQVLEHLPYEDFQKAMTEIFRIAKKRVVISLPDAGIDDKPNRPNCFDGEHYWEINKIGYELIKIKEAIENIAKGYYFSLDNEYRVPEMTYHHFFVLNKVNPTVEPDETLPKSITQQDNTPHSIQSQITKIENNHLKLIPQPILNLLIYNIVTHCNLNCKGCMSLAPIIAKHFVSTEDIANDLLQISKITNKTLRHLEMQGGEPLLHPNLTEIITIARKIFPYTHMKIVTNGLLLPKKEDAFWIACNNNNIEVSVTKYPINLNYTEIERTAKSFGVTYSYYGSTNKKVRTLYKDTFDLLGRQDPQKNFIDCPRANNYTNIREGKIYPCAVILNAVHFNKLFHTNMTISEHDTLDINKIESYEQISTFLATPKPFCRYCNPKKRVEGIPWGLSKREISEWV